MDGAPVNIPHLLYSHVRVIPAIRCLHHLDFTSLCNGVRSEWHLVEP